MAGTNLGQVSCLAAVPAYYFGRYLAILDSMYGAATAPAFTLEECFRQFSLAWSAPGAWGPGLRASLVLLSGPRGVTLYCVRFVITLFLAAFGSVPALRLFANELPRDPHTVAA